jgi:segregation and condensation protein A
LTATDSAEEQDSSGQPDSDQPDSADAPQEAESSAPRQKDLPFAMIAGKAMTEAPKDLYIPPDALEIFLEAFEGPLDLLLYLIKKQNIDILDINVADITDQYMAYVDIMQASQFELAAEYLVMAAMLAEIKSRILLPRQKEEEEDEEDPRMQLIKRLQEYERYKKAAEDVDELPRLDRDIQLAGAALPEIDKVTPDPEVGLDEVLACLARVLRRADMFEHHHIQMETLSTREKMSEILARISSTKFVPLVSLLIREEGRLGVVVTFLAMMELMKDSLIEIVQSDPFAPIHIKSRDGSEAAVVATDNE